MDEALGSEKNSDATLDNEKSLTELCRRLFGHVPTSIASVGEGSNGCQAFKLQIGDEWIKCYECDSEERAQGVQLATSILQANSIPIPRVRGAIGRVVFAEWIDGESLGGTSERTIRRLVAYQAEIHRAQSSHIDKLPSRFVHLEWLTKRMEMAGVRYAAVDRLKAVSQTLFAAMPPNVQYGIVHPDFILPNVIYTEKKQLVVVDNEFLAVGIGREFDILNSAEVISGGNERLKREYMESYGAIGDCGTLIEYYGFWTLCYMVKIVGKAFLFGECEKGLKELDLLEDKLREYSSLTI